MNKTIIHICGPSGSGKTCLGKRLKELFGAKIIVKDLDNLRDEFIKNFYGGKRWTYIDESKYQKHIDNYIANKRKPIVFVGLNDNTRYGKNKELYYNLHSTHNYYINIDDKILVKQKCLRLLNDIQSDKAAINDLMNNNELFLDKFTLAIKHECSLSETAASNNKWKSDYLDQNYRIMLRENIYKNVVKLLNKLV